MKSILLHVGDDEAFESRFQVALDLVREFDGHLTCLQPVAFEMVYAGDYFGDASALAMSAARDLAEEHRKEIEARLSNEDVAWNWISEFGAPQYRVTDRASLHDLTVLGPLDPVSFEGHASSLVGAIAIHSRTPVLVVPRATKGIDVDGPALVAWNGSVEAANAMRSAMPILRRASAVFLAVVGEQTVADDDSLTPMEAAAYLSRHGVPCEILALARHEAGIARSLTEAATSRNASCIVMGAYGHSRLREMVFGGVTRDMLAGVAVPLVMAH